ncbi:MAG: histidine kinase [Chloroflexi bacterium RBG_16_48_7]|nr:MAG: histidine kinase [Chloroflexi bacterium RBG_16_48_7]
MAKNNKEELRKLFERLHGGANLSDIKNEFQELIKTVSPTDIAEVEEDLIKKGMPQEQIHKLCDVHMAVLKESMGAEKELAPSGHPINILMEEHKILLGLAGEAKEISADLKSGKTSLGEMEGKLVDIAHHVKDSENHYVREENVLFPFLEKHGITQPPAIMWMEHDKIRELKKNFHNLIGSRKGKNEKQFIDELNSVSFTMVETLSSHYYKENNILFPAGLEVIEEAEWKDIKKQFDELGYCCFTPPSAIKGKAPEEEIEVKMTGGTVSFETGQLAVEEIDGIFNHLPVDITFVGKDDTVHYFSQSPERIFTRTKAVIGRSVQKCHPDKSIHKVNIIIEDFKAGRRREASFWINMGGKLIYIRYFPVRNKKGDYLGVLEVTQDITEIMKIKGEKRLLD